MRIVLTHPFCWPYVRRGSERNIEDVALYLVGQGHEVTTISTHPGPKTIEVNATGKRILHGPCWTPLLGRVRIQSQHTFFFSALRSLRSLEPDVVHSFYYSDAMAASYVRKRRYRSVFQMNGIAIPGVSCYRFPPEAWMWRQALARADERITCSRFIQNLLLEHYGADSIAIHTPVDVDAFPLGRGPSDVRPTILSVADFNVRSKGVRVLVRAFQIVKSKVPSAVLKLSGRLSDALRAELLRDLPEAVKCDIHILGLGNLGDVPALCRGASVMALPSMWEPSGRVIVEAWSSGTPVVMTNHGGLPEFMSEGVGYLFDPKTNEHETHNAEGLAESLLQGLELSQQEGIRERCHEHAQKFSTHRIGPLIEKVYAGS